MKRRKVLALPLALAASGCVATRLELPPMSEERIKSVVILTSFGNTVHLKRIPPSPDRISVKIDNQFAEVNWDVDNHVRSRLAERLMGKCEVKTVNYNPADLFSDAIVDRVRRIVPTGLADAIIVVSSLRPKFDERALEKLWFALIGSGLVAENDPRLAGVDTLAFARSYVYVHDGRTFEVIATRVGTNKRSEHDVLFPVEPLPFSYTGGGWVQLSQDQRTQLRDAILRILDQTVTHTFGPHIVDKPHDSLATSDYVRDAKRWNAVMARLGLPSTP